MFDRSFVISLDFKTDRLVKFQKQPSMDSVEVWPAVHGDSVKHPSWWTSGNGAWGCYRSHLQILEYCYQRQSEIESYLVFEDDAILREDFDHQISEFMKNVPADWEMIYFGGQLLHENQHPPLKVVDGVFIPYNVNRTHCFAVHRRGYEKLYRHLNATPFHNGEHIDHHLGRLHESGSLKIFCPGKWLVGQDAGPSNISGNQNAATFWVDPEKLADTNRTWQKQDIPAIFLQSPNSVAVELDKRGWHRGHWRNENLLDRGICNALSSIDAKSGLEDWYKAVLPEAVREGHRCICLYHPTLTWELVSKLGFAEFKQIDAESVDMAEQKLDGILRGIVSELKTEPKRNLIYHIWPKAGNGVWQWNVEQLLKRIEQFDGTRSIGVTTSAETDSLQIVKDAFGGVRIDNWIEVPNNPHMGEANTFVSLLGTIPRDDSITFRGHAKGVRYDDQETIDGIREWSEMLYEICLDDHEHVAASLKQFDVTGPFMVDGEWTSGNRYGWFYSGGFYWFTSEIFKKTSWNEIRPDYWGVELWLGEHFPRTEAGVLFGQGCAHLYHEQERERMKQWLSEWRVARRKEAA